MSSDSFKNKGKRSRSSSEANNSFVKNVTSRVSGLLPTTITKWFSSPSSSNTNGSAPTADSTDSSTEDEAPDNGVITQPPTKRMRYSSPTGKFNTSETNLATTSIDTPETCSPYSTVQSPPGRNTFRRETNFVSTPLHTSDKDVKTEKSDRDSTMFKSQPTIAAAGQSISSKRISLFDSTSSKEASIKACVKSSNNTIKDPKQPYFKPTLLGSPFYPGRTIYGGAAVSYMNEPNIKQRKVTYVKEANNSENSTMSNSTRRIMDLLEEYSSPLAEAKRIQQYIENNNSILPYTTKALPYKTRELLVPSVASIFRLRQKSRLMDTTNAARQIIASHSSAFTPRTAKITGNEKPDSEYVSLKASSKIKTHLTRTNRGADLEEPSVPLNLPNAVLTIDQNNLPQFSFDMVASTSTPISSSKSIFPKPSFSQTTATVTKSTDTLKTETASSEKSFKFTSPDKIPSSLASNCTTPPHFTFGSPERSIDKAKVVGFSFNDTISKEEGSTKSNKITSSSKDWQCKDCWVNNKFDSDKCVCCGGKKPVMVSMSDKSSAFKIADCQPNTDKCRSCEESQVCVANKLSEENTTDLSTWKCEDCWVSNTVSDGKCVCCGAKNPNKTYVDPLKQTTKTTEKDWKCDDCWVINLMSDGKCVCCGAKNPNKSPVKVTKPATNTSEKDWKCEDCWVSNKRSLEKCAACGGAKPGSKESSNTGGSKNNNFPLNSLFKPVDSSFKAIVENQSNMWECASCLVRNEGNKSKCVCCETDRDGAKTSSENKFNFNFGVKTNNTFKFGIDSKPEQQTILDDQIDTITNQNSLPKKEESETNNNVLAKTPKFLFTSPVKKNKVAADSIKVDGIGAPKMNFTFGMPKQLPNEQSLVSTKTDNEDNEKPQEVPKIDLATETKDDEKPSGILFNPPLISKDTLDKTTIASPLLSSGINTENKENTSKCMPFLKPTVATTAVTQSQSSFSFAPAVGTKPSQNLFTAPSSSSPVVNVSFMSSSQSAPVTSAVASTTSAKSLFQTFETATTFASPIFQKSSPINTSNVSLFQKNETVTKAVPPPAATAPIFSFGNNISSTAPLPTQPEKPMFNFSFGSANKTEASSIFQPATFGNDVGTPNNFTRTPGNEIGASNAVSTNSLGGGVALSTGNALINSGTLGSGKGLSNSLGTPLRGSNELPTDTLAGGNSLPSSNALPNTASGIMFGRSVQKENLWSSNNNASTNLFVTNSTTAASSLQKPTTFTFGSSAPFNASNTTTPTFGNNAQPAQSMFRMSNQNNNSAVLFSTPVPNQTATSIFGAAPAPSNAAPTMGMFGTPNVGSAPAFGTPNQSVPSFEAPSMAPAPAPAPAFSFGGSLQSPIFGFGQQQQQAQQQQPHPQPPPQQQQHQQHQQQQQSGPQAGMYNFGGSPAGSPQVQFNMGSAPNTTMRRVRKAVRRNPQR